MKKITIAINYLKRNDAIMAGLIRNHNKCDLKPSRTYFKNLVKSIISQQLSNKASATIYNRFALRLENNITADNILELSNNDFRESGISKQKMNYLIELSKVYKKNELFFKSLRKHSNDEIIAKLTKIKGIGVWTAQMFLIFSVNRLNILPLDDIGIQNAIKLHYRLKKKPNKEKILKIAKNWGDYSSIACWYLWKALDSKR